MARLQGKVAVVTGASLGIGAAIAEHLAEEGAAVVVNYGKSKEAADAVVHRIQQKGGKAVAVSADVRQRSQIQKLFQTELGTANILVNNAGVYEFRPLTEIDEEHIDRQFSLNVKGLVIATQEFVKALGGQPGSIINISSVVADNPPPGGAIYSATKAAVNTITQTLAKELGSQGVRINSLSPGSTTTEGFRDMDTTGEFAATLVKQTPLGRMGEPSDIARVATFLASDDSSWITGQTITASGGLR